MPHPLVHNPQPAVSIESLNRNKHNTSRPDQKSVASNRHNAAFPRRLAGAAGERDRALTPPSKHYPIRLPKTTGAKVAPYMVGL